ncbi:MAG: LPS assembly lipoprotein LptE [Arcobacteraceae bacterium]
MIKKVLLLTLFLFVLVGCGYKPSSHYAKERIQGNVFVDIDVSIEDPKNSVIIKDAMSEILVSRFGAKIVYNKEIADTILNLKLNAVSMQILQYDAQGYAKLYQAVVNIKVDYLTNEKKGSVTVSGTYDFSVDGQDEISEAKRFEAVKNASSKALEEVISKLAIESFRKVPMTKEELEEELKKEKEQDEDLL